ncbi:cob(I)yrinic acid a,c-diamide adenosyltransferase [Calderihabitans maritimus]|uniref:ATP:corrinoid adenosyltransferase n=1 Tax=Calderihabitans maritimus TaxID=1246530 RepID=A0A1Z5HNL9_9FIRM|nr:cob(I)yrinic acid a,c-diamide adenosyltransferase [Calderihabitans maritimus]GAW91048.1 ATP:corrinoid adenosyltransferase [Calderihabitans maritimus]
MVLEKGLVQLYTGDSKGKTTAALGLSLRAVGHGFRVFIVQFLKTGQNYGELKSIARLYPEVQIKSFGAPGFIAVRGIQEEDRILAREAMDFVWDLIKNPRAEIIILDEITNALYYNLIDVKEVLELIRHKPEGVELVMTGRNAPEELIQAADLVTEMRSIKHPYQKGIGSRRGIEY